MPLTIDPFDNLNCEAPSLTLDSVGDLGLRMVGLRAGAGRRRREM